MADAIEPELLPPAPDEPEGEGETKSFLDHLEDLRWMLVKMAAALGIGMLCAFFFAPNLLAVAKYPLARATDQPEKYLLPPLEVTGSFMLSLTLSFYAGAILASPFLTYFLGQFILPALTPKEKGLVRPVVLGGSLLFLAGASLAYFMIVPTGIRFFIGHNKYLFGLEPKWLIQNYISFVSHMVLAFGACFEFPLIVLVLAKLGIVTHEFLRQKRAYVIVIIFIVAGIITPSVDIPSQCALALPMCLLYEACIWIAWWMERRKRNTPAS